MKFNYEQIKNGNQLMEYLLIWKLVKYIGLLLFSGSLGVLAIRPLNNDSQWTAVNWGMGIGFFLLWVGGYGMIKSLGFNIGSTWVVYGQFFSIACTFFAAHQACGIKPGFSMNFALTSLALALTGMILKEYAINLLHYGAILVLAGGAYVQFGKTAYKENGSINLKWFRLIAWLEGLSLLILLFIYMPLKYLVSINLDDGQGWFGWVHGVLQIMFLLSIINLQAARILMLVRSLLVLLHQYYPLVL
ncbi:MAG: DUF3817 domain-containing protein [Oligoflexales bacterium]